MTNFLFRTIPTFLCAIESEKTLFASCKIIINIEYKKAPVKNIFKYKNT